MRSSIPSIYSTVSGDPVSIPIHTIIQDQCLWESEIEAGALPLQGVSKLLWPHGPVRLQACKAVTGLSHAKQITHCMSRNDTGKHPSLLHCKQYSRYDARRHERDRPASKTICSFHSHSLFGIQDDCLVPEAAFAGAFGLGLGQRP